MPKMYFDPTKISQEEMRSIHDKIIDNSSSGETKCVLWKMGLNGVGYPQIKLGKAFNNRFGDRQYNPGHLLLSMKMNLILNIPNYHISHRCYLKKCINTDHLSYKPAHINKFRDHCFGQKCCTGHFCITSDKRTNYEDCIFLKIVLHSINKVSCVHIMMIVDIMSDVIGKFFF